MNRNSRILTDHGGRAPLPLRMPAVLLSSLALLALACGDDGDESSAASGGETSAQGGNGAPPGQGGTQAGGRGGRGSGGAASGGRASGGRASGTGGESSETGGEPSDGGADGTGGGSGGGVAKGGSGSGGKASTGGSTNPPEMCGDLTCQPSEACDTCEADCGACEEPPMTECNDGVDNDGDGLVDWQLDVGCWSELDASEASGSREEESGWTTFDLSEDSKVVYVSSSDGDDANDGSSPDSPVATPARGAALVRDGFPDFLLFKRGDTWRNQDLGADRVARRFKSGRDAEHPIVIASYGGAKARPRIELNKPFLDDDGNARNYIAIIGLALISYPKVPGDSDFNGADGGTLRFVGTGHDILAEDLYTEYGDFGVQGVTNFTLRRSVVYRAYHVGTCLYREDGTRDPNGNNAFRPAGIYSSNVNGLVLEDNVFDENGWNPDVEDACATIYNHNMYLSRSKNLVVKNNLLLRASSMGLKMESAESDGAHGVVIENNLFAEGEIGLSMGGNGTSSYRFVDVLVKDNVFTDIGRSQPTQRGLAWYMEIQDNDNTEITGNLLVNAPMLNNSFGVKLMSNTNRNVWVHDNLFYDLIVRSIDMENADAFSEVRVEQNTLVKSSNNACLLEHSGGFDQVLYAGNAYRSGGAENTWFCIGSERLALDGWTSASGEEGAVVADLEAPEPGRNLDTYAEHLGIGSSIGDFAAAARQQSRFRYRAELTANAANNYIRGGFGQDPR
jgi:hypothetical protein